MPGARDHEPLVIEEFQGWWRRGDPESAPSDHFIQADNIQFFHSGVETRDGLNYFFTFAYAPLLKILRVYNYVTQKGHSLLVLGEGGIIYHVLGPSDNAYNPILTIPAMEDFGFVAINGRAYITPFKTYTNERGEKYQLGLQNEFLYVYGGDPAVPARKAGGPPPASASAIVLSEFGTTPSTDAGFHIVAAVYETDTGYLTGLGPAVFGGYGFSGNATAYVSSIPVSPNSYVKKRHLVSTKTIADYSGGQLGQQYFFIPGGTINDNTTTTWSGGYYDSDLISDASHLVDNFSEIPAGVSLNTYHSRLVLVGEYGTTETLANLPTGITDNRSIARVSFPGEPEAISKIDGLLIAPLDGKPLTNVQEFRDILYLFKNTRTFAYADNNDVPATWQEEILDQGIGASVHGVASVLDTGGVNIDFLVITDWSGLMLFNGTYAQPELSWKIEDFWRSIDRSKFNQIQIVNDSINKKIWITLPDPLQGFILHADYSNGMNTKSIRWAKWIFNANVSSIALYETDKLVIGTTSIASTGVPTIVER